jgi:hypothetical protein
VQKCQNGAIGVDIIQSRGLLSFVYGHRTGSRSLASRGSASMR